MKIITVGNRAGQAVVNWPGLLLGLLLATLVTVVGVAIFIIAVGWYEPKAWNALLFALPMNLAMIGLGVKRGLKKPVGQLPILA